MSQQSVWASDAWREDAVAWLDERLRDAGIRRTGDVEQPHLRPWATVLKVPTTRGPLWFKAAAPATAFEIALYELLARAVPDRVLIPIAVDVERAWIVLPDGGPRVADSSMTGGIVDAFELILPHYAELQRRLEVEVEDALALGVADMRAAILPARLDEALELVAPSVRHRGDADGRATLDAVTALRATYASWCAKLAEAPGAPSLDHNDLHAWNMLVEDLDRPASVRFYDWGDAVVAHPFACMLVPLTMTQRELDSGPHDPALLRVRDAYLEAFSDLAAHAELVETLELACRVGKVARALTWERAMRAAGREDADERFVMAPLHCLRSLLDASYLGGA